MTYDDSYIPFSQREGYQPIPPQLKLGEVSHELRRLIDYSISLEIDRATRWGPSSSYFDNEWKLVATDFHVKFLKSDIDKFKDSPFELKTYLAGIIKRVPFPTLIDLVEFFLRHRLRSTQLKDDLARALVETRAAYRVIDNMIVAVGSGEQADALIKAVNDAEESDAKSARRHLLTAGKSLRDGDWAGSVRESIHAVEATARKLAGDKKSLAPALTELEKKGHLHGSLKAALGSLYGYTSDEEGVRHSLVFKDEAKVDETDALFMLGACASFVSYLLARTNRS